MLSAGVGPNQQLLVWGAQKGLQRIRRPVFPFCTSVISHTIVHLIIEDNVWILRDNILWGFGNVHSTGTVEMHV